MSLRIFRVLLLRGSDYPSSVAPALALPEGLGMNGARPMMAAYLYRVQGRERLTWRTQPELGYTKHRVPAPSPCDPSRAMSRKRSTLWLLALPARTPAGSPKPPDVPPKVRET